MSCFVKYLKYMMFLVIQHWVAPAITISNLVLVEVSRPFLSRLHCFLSWLHCFLGFPFSDMKLLRMMSTVIFYHVICDCLVFADK